MIAGGAHISAKAQIGSNVKLGFGTIVHDNVIIGDNVEIDSYCEIGYPTKLAEGKPLKIGKDSLIRSHSVFYEGSEFKEGLKTGHRVTIREKTIAGLNLQIGTLCDFQGHLTIGDYCRTHSNVHLGQASKIGNFVWIFPYTVLTNDPHPPSNKTIGVTIEDYAIVATMVCVLPGITIGTHSLVGASSMVNRNVNPYTIVAGNPAKEIGPTSKIKLKDFPEVAAYPWPKHFHRGYPDDVVATWKTEYSS